MQALLANKKALFAIVGGIVVVVVIMLLLQGGGSSDMDVTAGQIITVTVIAPSLEDVYGYQFQLNYADDEFEVVGDPRSLNEITTIFAVHREGHQLVGATLVGERPGINGKNVKMCELDLTAKKDGKISEMSLSLSKVNEVKSNLEYVENVPGWTFTVKASDNGTSEVSEAPAA